MIGIYKIDIGASRYYIGSSKEKIKNIVLIISSNYGIKLNYENVRRIIKYERWITK